MDGEVVGLKQFTRVLRLLQIMISSQWVPHVHPAASGGVCVQFVSFKRQSPPYKVLSIVKRRVQKVR